jgi:GH15 family glucan-1,4-alpha-glucosidase
LPQSVYTTQLIEDHGVIGNMRSTAMIAVDGTIDFFCVPDFDSPTIFAALLDAEKGGYFSIRPSIEGLRQKQMYLPDTNILLTRFLSEDSVAEVTDFMPVQESEGASAYAHQILRMVRVIKGEVTFELRCAPRFDYARGTHRACKEQDAVCFHSESTDCPSMALHATVPLSIDGADAVATFTLRSNECASFAFGSVKKEEKAPRELLDPERIDALFQASAQYWREWIGRSVYKGRWREIVNRSALVLKLLSSQKHGALLAAATFGLPEQLGGSRNWDYRYTWLRDASFTLYALVRLGFVGEVQAYTQFLKNRLMEGLNSEGQDGPLRIMYRADGGDHLAEVALDHLSGYKDSRPVRVGNSAVDQLQLDIYGEVLDAVYLSNKYSNGIPKDGWRKLLQVMDWLADNWERPDEGIWEVRGGRKHLLHSRLMCWVAFDRVIRLADKRSFDAPLEKWRDNRRRINDDILDNFWSDELQSFVQAKGETQVDASMLLMPMMRYISPVDPRWLSTLKRIEDCLTEDSLVFRYPVGTDGLDGSEGSFSACSFWLIECLARAGQLDKARLLFDKMLGYANHLGLYSEQLGSSGEHLGNFPQALTHLALISAASMLDRKLDGTKETWA